MKIRLNFVSNSSSTSFCLYGKRFDDDSILENIDLGDELKLEYSCNSYDDSITIGLPPKEIKNDETGLQFKQRVFKLMKEKNLVEEDDLTWITDGGYNG